MIAVAGGRLLLRAAPESLAALLADGLDGIHAISDPFHQPRNCGLYLAGWAAPPASLDLITRTKDLIAMASP